MDTVSCAEFKPDTLVNIVKTENIALIGRSLRISRIIYKFAYLLKAFRGHSYTVIFYINVETGVFRLTGDGDISLTPFSQNGSNLISKKIETMDYVESKVKSFPTLSTFCSSFVQDLFFSASAQSLPFK